MAFIILAFTQVVHSFNMRSDHSLFRIGPFTNHRLNAAALVSTILMVLVCFIPPVTNLFGFNQASMDDVPESPWFSTDSAAGAGTGESRRAD